MAKMRAGRGANKRFYVYCHIFLSSNITDKLKTRSDSVFCGDSNYVLFYWTLVTYKMKNLLLMENMWKRLIYNLLEWKGRARRERIGVVSTNQSDSWLASLYENSNQRRISE